MQRSGKKAKIMGMRINKNKKKRLKGGHGNQSSNQAAQSNASKGSLAIGENGVMAIKPY